MYLKMGYSIMDRFSLLHFATGVIAYYWGVSLQWWIVMHTIFEYIENTTWGMHTINKYFTMWPGGKSHADSLINNLGDTIFAILGWLVSKWIKDLN